MDVDDSAVDLSVRSLPPELSELRALTASGLTITPAQPPPHGASGRRVLRPRSEQRSYAESPDIVLLPAAPPLRKPSVAAPAPFTDVSSKLNSGAVNVSITPSAVPIVAPESPRDPRDEEESEDDENEPPLPIIGHKELSSAEIWERERRMRALREKLRAEETRLVLLRKIRQSQQSTGLPPAKDSATGTALAGSGCVVPPGVTVTPAPPPAHQQNKYVKWWCGPQQRTNATSGSTGSSLGGSSSIVPGGYSGRRAAALPGGATLTPGPYRSQVSRRPPHKVVVWPTTAHKRDERQHGQQPGWVVEHRAGGLLRAARGRAARRRHAHAGALPLSGQSPPPSQSGGVAHNSAQTRRAAARAAAWVGRRASCRGATPGGARPRCPAAPRSRRGPTALRSVAAPLTKWWCGPQQRTNATSGSTGSSLGGSSSIVPGGYSGRRAAALPGGATLTPGPYRSQVSRRPPHKVVVWPTTAHKRDERQHGQQPGWVVEHRAGGLLRAARGRAARRRHAHAGALPLSGQSPPPSQSGGVAHNSAQTRRAAARAAAWVGRRASCRGATPGGARPRCPAAPRSRRGPTALRSVAAPLTKWWCGPQQRTNATSGSTGSSLGGSSSIVPGGYSGRRAAALPGGATLTPGPYRSQVSRRPPHKVVVWPTTAHKRDERQHGQQPGWVVEHRAGGLLRAARGRAARRRHAHAGALPLSGQSPPPSQSGGVAHNSAQTRRAAARAAAWVGRRASCRGATPGGARPRCPAAPRSRRGPTALRSVAAPLTKWWCGPQQRTNATSGSTGSSLGGSSSIVPGGYSGRRAAALPGGATLTPGPYRSQVSRRPPHKVVVWPTTAHKRDERQHGQQPGWVVEHRAGGLLRAARGRAARRRHAHAGALPLSGQSPPPSQSGGVAHNSAQTRRAAARAAAWVGRRASCRGATPGGARPRCPAAPRSRRGPTALRSVAAPLTKWWCGPQQRTNATSGSTGSSLGGSSSIVPGGYSGARPPALHLSPGATEPLGSL
ncbi:hypothetical protein ACJJTC_001952 [Scirpophaga incertulas]